MLNDQLIKRSNTLSSNSNSLEQAKHYCKLALKSHTSKMMQKQKTPTKGCNPTPNISPQKQHQDRNQTILENKKGGNQSK